MPAAMRNGSPWNVYSDSISPKMPRRLSSASLSKYLTRGIYYEFLQFVKADKDLAFKSGVGLRFIRELEQGKPTVRVDKVNQVLALFSLQLGAVPMERRTDQ